MDRLAEQVVEWHNRHPLAKRITIYDVHTIGVVALPFMRRGGPTAPGVEPVLSEEVSPESLAHAISEETTVAAHPNAEHLDALADQEPPPPGAPSARTRLQRLLLPLRALAALLPARIRRPGNLDCWPVFSEAFVPGLSARRVAAFAEEHGYATRPGDETWPQRVIAVDDALAAKGGGDGGGAWPMELYLKSAAIDVGTSRSRVLVGRGGLRPPIVGRRCWNWRRVALVGVVLALLAGAATWRFWPGRAEQAAAAAAAASAARTASGALQPASGASASGAASAAADAASAPASGASDAATAASAAPAASTAASAAASMPDTVNAAGSAPLVDIRPQLAMPGIDHTRMGKPIEKAPPLEGASAAAASTPATATAPRAAGGERTASAAAATPAASTPPPPKRAAETPPAARLAPPPLNSEASKQAAAGPAPQAPGLQAPAPEPGAPAVTVALVGPPSRDQASAEALLKRMLEMINSPTAPKPSRPLESRVFKTPDGWRPAVYPFDSREQAQIINLNLVANGLHTKAVNF